MRYTIHADGGARGNPGPAGAGGGIRHVRGCAAAAGYQVLRHTTTNFAEYEAVILAFEELAKLVPPASHKKTEVVVKMDSELVVKQMNKVYKVKHLVMKEQAARLARAAAVFGTVTYTHIPRAQNSDADALANQAMDLRG